MFKALAFRILYLVPNKIYFVLSWPKFIPINRLWKINRLYERCLRIIYNDRCSDF